MAPTFQIESIDALRYRISRNAERGMLTDVRVYASPALIDQIMNAGRLLSRTAAAKGRDAKQVERKLEEQGIIVRSESRQGIVEEIPEAYKDVDEVIDVVDRAGLARKVARLRPMGVIKG